MSGPSYKLDAVAFAEHLLEIADEHGTAKALVTLGENWGRLDSVSPVTPLLQHWAKDFTSSGLRALLMGDIDRHAEHLFRLNSDRKAHLVYRPGFSSEHAQAGLVWFRGKRHARKHGRDIGAGFLATGTLRPNAYAAVKYLGGGRVEFIVLPEAGPIAVRVETIGGRRNG